MKFSPTDLRISTHTATCHIDTLVNLKIIAKYLKIDDTITYIEFGDKIKKGVNMKTQSKKSKEKKRVFFNQITFIISPSLGRLNNVKLFNNGSISMTGLKYLGEGEISVQKLINKIKNINGVYYENLTDLDISDLKISQNSEIPRIKCMNCSNEVSCNNVNKLKCNKHYICKLCSNTDYDKCKSCNISLLENGIISICKLKNFKIVLINSDYYLGFELKRDVLHDLLVNKYNLFSSYEPCIYPGVNSKYYFNELYLNKEFKGKCYCDVYCNGKGDGKEEGKCKKITISVFQSGSIIITGARSMSQINIAYKYINNIINENYELVKKNEFLALGPINEKKKIIKLNKTNIINYPSKEQLEKYLIVR